MQSTETLLQVLLRNRDMTMASLARKLGVEKSTVTRWSKRQVPPERLVDIEKATGISRRDLRPDLFRDLSSGSAS